MSRSRAFSSLNRISRIASLCTTRGLSTRDAIDEAARPDSGRAGDGPTRREVLAGLGAAALTGGAAALGVPPALAGPVRTNARIAVVGAGLAGLACVDRLERAGLTAVLYEGNPTRVGGRCFSNRTLVPGMTAENGGEFIDTTHKTMLAYAREFGLRLEDVTKAPGEIFYVFDGVNHSEEAVVEEYRILVARMRPDLRASSGAPTFYAHNAADVALDHTDLASYLALRAGDLPLIRRVLEVAYVAEYGLEIAEQSSLNLLLFLHLDRRAKFAPFGVFSDERYHCVDGNDAIATGIRDRLRSPVVHGAKLERLSRNAFGRYELRFADASQPELADAVVLAIPFTMLRDVELDASLGFSDDKRRAIQDLGYGTNAKTMIAFDGRPWRAAGSNGSLYTGTPGAQAVWETNFTRAGARGILTDYASGIRGASLDPAAVPAQVEAFLAAVDPAWPGTAAAASRVGGVPVAHLEHWPSSPWVRASYTCYRPGQFTEIAGLEGEPADLVKFAGEHANSFYEWQGFLEGALLSGIDAAKQIVADVRRGRL